MVFQVPILGFHMLKYCSKKYGSLLMAPVSALAHAARLLLFWMQCKYIVAEGEANVVGVVMVLSDSF